VTHAALEALLPVPPDDLVATRREAVSAFLAERALDPGELAAFMLDRVGPGELLLTSSPVHGLANPTSDLDFIRVQEAAITGPRVSTKIFERGHHLEVVSFSAAEVERNLDALAELATAAPAEVVAGFRTWDKRFEPRRKQTERIVNGLTLDGRAPYLPALPALALIWSRAALQAAAEQAAHLCLAEAAGETRARVGYACNVLLHLMDCVLSLHGDVYTTRKWYLLRWARFVRRDVWHDGRYAALAAGIERARATVTRALGPDHRSPLAGAFAALVTEAARATGAAASIDAAVTPAGDAEHHPFLPGSGVVRAAGRSLLVAGGWPPQSAPAPLADLAGLHAGAAATALRAIRAGLATTGITYRPFDDEEGTA
jgi:Family of unknown function (DUF6001)